MLGQIIAIARNTFLESVRQPIFFVLVIAGWILQIFNTLLSSYSMGYTDTAEVSGDDKLLLDIGLATVFVLATLLAAFIATAVLSREIENKTALTVISKPVGRPRFVFGKYLGVVGAVLVATTIMLVFFHFAMRHGVMTTARDRPDGPVILFSLLIIGLSVGIGIWGNFFYGWVFSSTSIFVMLPASLIGWLAILILDKEWQLQPLSADFKPQIMIASACVLLAMTVLCAVAVTASTRLGQVMTIVVCAGAFMMGLLSNHIVGRHAFQNSPIGVVASAEVERDLDGDFLDGADTWRIRLLQDPVVNLAPGRSIYYGPTPNGIGLRVPAHEPFEGDPTDLGAARDPEGPKALIIHSIDIEANELVLLNVGGIQVSRPPREGDSLFLRPTRINPAAWAAWGVVPNLQFFWLVDAVTQNHPIPPRYLGLVGIYTLVHITGLLALAVILFQKREVG
ncbi:MAG: ABC transporter permease [Phycisphaeraceae bacterium]|nr:MAG: ABC transporter permease [Phycisphaeraceae bacterium]